MPAQVRSMPPAWKRARQIVVKSQLRPAVSFFTFISIGPLREGAELPNIWSLPFSSSEKQVPSPARQKSSFLCTFLFPSHGCFLPQMHATLLQVSWTNWLVSNRFVLDLGLIQWNKFWFAQARKYPEPLILKTGVEYNCTATDNERNVTISTTTTATSSTTTDDGDVTTTGDGGATTTPGNDGSTSTTPRTTTPETAPPPSTGGGTGTVTITPTKPIENVTIYVQTIYKIKVTLMEAVLGNKAQLSVLRNLPWCQITAEDYPLFLNDEELGNKNKTANCSIEIYGQPYNEICDNTTLAGISVTPFNQFKVLDEMDFDKEYGKVFCYFIQLSVQVLFWVKQKNVTWRFLTEICSRFKLLIVHSIKRLMILTAVRSHLFGPPHTCTLFNSVDSNKMFHLIQP